MIKKRCKYYLQLAEKHTPQTIKNLLYKIGADKLWMLLLNKSDVELFFQANWAEEFASNKGKVLEYWEKYRFLDEVRSVCNIDKAKKILDVGCGISTILHYIEGEKYGIDPLANEYVKIYDYPKDIMIQNGLGEDIPFQSQFFDIIFCSNVLDHTTSPSQTLNEIHRVLKKSGFFILTVEIFQTGGVRDLAHPHNFTHDNLFSLLDKKFITLFQNTSPWIGLRRYFNGSNNSNALELIVICQKR